MKEKIITSDKGVALVLGMMLLVILSLMGAAAIMTTSTETKIAANTRKANQAFYSADAGIESARTMISWTDSQTSPPITNDTGDPFTYQVNILGRIDQGEVRVFNVESRGWDPFNRSQRVIRADIEISKTRGAVDEGGYLGGY